MNLFIKVGKLLAQITF